MALAKSRSCERTREWACLCGTEWETRELDGQPATRHVTEIRHDLRGRGRYLSGGYVPRSAFAPEPPEPPKPEPDAPPERTIAGSVIGYRAWRIMEWKLIGTAVNRFWHPGVNEATCDPGLGMAPLGQLHSAPAADCSCGITALARFDQGDRHWTNADVFGAIEAWSDDSEEEQGGRFFLHRNGFRAQYGKIVLLAVNEEWPGAKQAAVRSLAREHQADVCKHEHLQDAAREHGQLVPDEMLQWAAEADDVQRARTTIGPSALTTGNQNTAVGVAVRAAITAWQNTAHAQDDQ